MFKALNFFEQILRVFHFDAFLQKHYFVFFPLFNEVTNRKTTRLRISAEDLDFPGTVVLLPIPVFFCLLSVLFKLYETNQGTIDINI